MNNDIKQITKRIKEMREILDIPAEAMAQRLGISLDEYENYESGEKDFSISRLYTIANIFDMDLTTLLTGDEPRLENQCVVKKGHGVSIDRYKGYSFSSLAYNYIHRVMEPLLVTISPSQTPPALVMHSGQEFNYILSGKVRVTVGKRSYVLEPGDSIYFNPQLPHGQEAIDGEASFLTVINE